MATNVIGKESVVIDGVRYESKPCTGNVCFGCVAHGTFALCQALPDCTETDVIWVKSESQPEKNVEAQELKAFFGGHEFPSEAEEEHFKRLDQELNKYDVVEKPKHYMLFEKEGIEVRDVIEKLVLKSYAAFASDNGTIPDTPQAPMFDSDYVQLMQYLMRFMDKNGVEDLKKARWYLDKMIGAYE